MQELFKKWANKSRTLDEFIERFSWWLFFQEIDPDNCYSDEDLKMYYNQYKTQ